MREPWKKHGCWPYEGPRGKTWQLGYRDHEGRVRSKSFKTKGAAERWSREYVDAERRNRLREFLLGSDAPEVLPDATPLAELILAGWRRTRILILLAGWPAALGTATARLRRATSSATQSSGT
jgi:hypothetical protein